MVDAARSRERVAGPRTLTPARGPFAGAGRGRRAFPGLLLAACLLAGAGPAFADDAADWLARMRAALAAQAFEGTLVHLRDGQLDALDVSHHSGPQGPVDHLRSRSGEPRDLQRSAGAARLSALDAAATPQVLVGATRAAGPPAAPPADVYRLVLLGNGRIAGRPTRLLEIRPRDGFRYGYRLWLDRETALPLKSVAFDPDGSAVEQWMFTAITFDPTVVAPPPAAGVPAADPAGRGRWQVRDLPPGFRRVSLTDSEAGGEHHVYSDGLARVSLFVEPLAEQGPTLSGVGRRGALSMVGRVAAGRQLTVIGEVPPLTAERIAQGVVPHDPG